MGECSRCSYRTWGVPLFTFIRWPRARTNHAVAETPMRARIGNLTTLCGQQVPSRNETKVKIVSYGGLAVSNRDAIE
jgi:hypothetical protein